MPTSKRLTKQALASAYKDDAWREAFLRLLSISQILRTCVISRGYKIPDEMNNSIYLTPAGSAIAQELKGKQDVPYKEAKLMCLLTMAFREPLIDVEKTNYAVLLEEISNQVKSGQIRYPFVFSRDLYDRAAEYFPDRRRYLTVRDTTRLLEGQPQGVWQARDILVGPFGAVVLDHHRGLPPETDIPLQHCADISCDRLHYVQLSTDQEAPINAHRYKFNRLLEQGDKEPSDWNGFITDLTGVEREDDAKDDLDPGSITYLLGDALADNELKLLLRHLLDRTKGLTRSYAEGFGLKGSSEDITTGLDRAQMMQLILCSSDPVISEALDDLVLSSRIDAPLGEVRRARINAAARFGPWQLSAQLGHRGVRFVGGIDLAVLRLHRLLRHLYDAPESATTLEWQLRGIDGGSTAEKLMEYSRTSSPKDILSRLVLVSREQTVKACEHVGVRRDDAWSDEQIVTTLLWKLGFAVRDVRPTHARFFERQDRILKLARGAQLSSSVEEAPIREAAVLYFEDLEYLLNDSLAFATWGLSTDHYAADLPYVFQPVAHTVDAMSRLSDAAVKGASTTDDVIHFSRDENTLYPLSRGFSILARLLEDISSNSDSYLRDEGSLPEYMKHTELRGFPLLHTVAYLDLTPSAQASILRGLKEVSRILTANNVPEVRNDLSHFRRTTVDIGKTIGALAGVEQAVATLESLGFLRVPYVHRNTVADDWGRSLITLASSDGQQVVFTRPSPFDYLRLPNLRQEQYLMHSAIFADPNEVLRFRLGFESQYEKLWSEYPKRREAGGTSVANQSESAAATIDPAGRVNTRTA